MNSIDLLDSPMFSTVNVSYYTIIERRSSLVIKVSGQMHSNAFKRRLAFSFTVIILA